METRNSWHSHFPRDKCLRNVQTGDREGRAILMSHIQCTPQSLVAASSRDEPKHSKGPDKVRSSPVCPNTNVLGKRLAERRLVIAEY